MAESVCPRRVANGWAITATPPAFLITLIATRRGQTLSAMSFPSLIDAGLNGVEVEHRDHSEVERKQLRELARDLGLVITGASDYHGTGKLNSIGENHTDPAEWARLESMADARRVVTE